MLFPMLFCMPCTYWALRQAAVARHMACGVYGTPWDRLSMRAIYGF